MKILTKLARHRHKSLFKYIFIAVFLYLLIVRFVPRAASPTPISNATIPSTTPAAATTDATGAAAATDAAATIVAAAAETFQCDGMQAPLAGTVAYRNEYWQLEREDADGEILLYRAFLDHREEGKRWLQILGLRRLLKNRTLAPLFCQIWWPDGSHVVTEVVSRTTGSDGWYDRNGLNYGQRLYSCEVKKSDSLPSHVSIVSKEKCKISTTYLPITNMDPQQPPKYNVTVCIEPLFEQYSSVSFVEWIEVHNMFGVDHFIIPNGSLDYNSSTPAIGKIIDHYVKKGIISWVQLPSAVEKDNSAVSVRLGSPAALNNCMMSSMYVSRYVLCIDLDELIVPRKFKTYNESIDTIHRISPRSEYSANMAYFFRTYKPDATKPAYLRSLRHRRRTQPNQMYFGSKAFVDPVDCLSVFNHYCYIKRSPNRGIVALDSELMLNHHYRYTCNKGATCKTYEEKSVVDDILLKYEKEIERRVVDTMTLVGGSGNIKASESKEWEIV